MQTFGLFLVQFCFLFFSIIITIAGIATFLKAGKLFTGERYLRIIISSIMFFIAGLVYAIYDVVWIYQTIVGL